MELEPAAPAGRAASRRTEGEQAVRRRGWRPGASLVALALLVLLPVPEASAQEPAEGPSIDTPYEWVQRSLRIGLVGGYLDADPGVSKLGPDATPFGGARFRARISSPISLEFGASYGLSDRLVIDPRTDAPLTPVDTVSSDWVMVDAAAQFAITGARTWHDLQPYAVLGAGLLVGVAEKVSPELSTVEDAPFRYEIGVAPGLQAGLGIEWHLSDRIGIGLEARDHLWRIKTPDGFFGTDVLDRFEDLDLPAPTETDWTHNLEFSIGVWRYF